MLSILNTVNFVLKKTKLYKNYTFPKSKYRYKYIISLLVRYFKTTNEYKYQQTTIMNY